MPQSARPRADDKDRSAKAQEQEFKRARGAISCAECRRLKLKCDKIVPCSSCKRRGCSSICPNGSLTTGQGTRFILADTDRLHRKIAEMSDRIRQLEDALALLQSSVGREPHPLLARDLLAIKSGLELHSAAMRRAEADAQDPESDDEDPQCTNAFGTLAVRDDGAATFYGRSAGSESLLLGEEPHAMPLIIDRPSVAGMSLPPSLLRLTTSFPSAPSDIHASDMRDLIEEFLPPWPRAMELCDLYLESAPWFFGAVTRRQLLEELLPLFYSEAGAARPPASAGSDAATGAPGMSASASAFNLPVSGRSGTSKSSSHDLALIFVIFCFGAVTDSLLPPPPHNTESDHYFQLTKAALNLESVLDRPPGVVTVQTLSLMAMYQGLASDDDSIEKTWALMGLSSKLAQTLGLHRDPARFNLQPAEVQKRRALFWEIFITDCWQALATGRIPSFALHFVDAEYPADPDETIAEDGTIQPSFPAWKAKYGKDHIYYVVQAVEAAQVPKYHVFLELDRKIRDTPLPKYSIDEAPLGAGLNKNMSHFMPLNYRELTLQYVHRSFFVKALEEHPEDPLRSQYAPSFLAGYRSACELIRLLREQFKRFPVQIVRFWVLWTHAFSSSVMLGAIATRCGVSKTGQAALAELRIALDLFEQAAPHGGRAVKFLPIIRRVHARACHSFTSGFMPRTRDIFTPRSAEHEQNDELSIFGGRTRTVATKANRGTHERSVSRRRPSGHPLTPTDSTGSSQGTPGSGSRESGSPQSASSETFPSLEAFGSAMHPSLAAQMRSFRGELDQQINSANAYYHDRVQAPPAPQQYAQPQPAFGMWYTPPNSGSEHGREMMPPPLLPSHAQHDQPHAAQHPQHHTASQLVPVAHPDMVLTGEYDHQVPVYGSVEHNAGQEDIFQYQSYNLPVPVSSDTPISSGYAMHAQQLHPHEPQPELWAVPPADMQGMYAGVAQPYGEPVQQGVQYVQHDQYNNAHSDVSGYGLGRYDAMHPPSNPTANTNGATYSLQETWMSFMRQELPASGRHPPSFSH
ncbi:hypothetical protein OBBRIDRAFT_892109 [Obba rivulosa]|uniref:Zn(2)-C6 fungal-type domain-containing protein n=1 Tax=Obba rivulosa TaxID=1052685 RepID=A0A8E2AGQ8_9APHY|nr:hypothetical protein OBBRIDRAFT_892109 [Obba rivulosa]